MKIKKAITDLFDIIINKPNDEFENQGKIYINGVDCTSNYEKVFKKYPLEFLQGFIIEIVRAAAHKIDPKSNCGFFENCIKYGTNKTICLFIIKMIMKKVISEKYTATFDLKNPEIYIKR